MSERHISREHFLRRLTRLLNSGDLLSWPRRREDRHILMKSVVSLIEPGAVYSETQLNDLIEEWVDLTGRSIRIDVANIRRALIDEGYLLRDRAGTRYELPGLGPGHFDFEPSIDEIDLRNVLADWPAARKSQSVSDSVVLPAPGPVCAVSHRYSLRAAIPAPRRERLM